MHSRKRRKVSEVAVNDICSPSAIVKPSPSPQVVRLSIPERDCPPQELSGLRKSLGWSSINPYKPNPSTPNSAPHSPGSLFSNVTSPTGTPRQELITTYPQGNQASTSSVISVGTSNQAEALPSKPLLNSTEGGMCHNEASKNKQAHVGRPRRALTSQTKREAALAKKAQDDQEKFMTPLQYASILQTKWHTRVSNTPPERLFLKNKVVFLVFEEPNKSTKDTRIKLDIVSNQAHGH